jgi:hypothetical protein
VLVLVEWRLQERSFVELNLRSDQVCVVGLQVSLMLCCAVAAGK